MPILGPKVSGRKTNFLPSLIILSASSSESRPSWRKWSRKISVLIEVPWYRSLKYMIYYISVTSLLDGWPARDLIA